MSTTHLRARAPNPVPAARHAPQDLQTPERRMSPLARVALAASPVAAITILAAVLRLWAFGRVGANPFYDAAVRSMGLSWHNFFFGAFEPGAQVAVDKAPADLWLQVASTKLFGFSGVAMRLPEALAGTLAVPLLFDLVRRLFGRVAGLAAAMTLAVLPAAILTAHSDTMDSVMMALDVLAAWLVVVGAQRGRSWPVLAAGAAVGLAFNVKLFEALIVLPALVLFVVLSAGPARKRLATLIGAGAALVAVGLGWVAVASLTPLGRRPWPIGSTDGSIWNVVFGYNGIDRVANPASAAALRLDPPGALRLLSASGHDYRATVGTTLLAAVVLGAAALLVAACSTRRSSSWRTPQVAGAALFGGWLIIGAGLFSHMQRLQPRYLEAVTPAIAAVVGIGVGVLAGHRQRAVHVALAAAATAVALADVLLVRPPAWSAALAAGGVLGVWVTLIAKVQLRQRGAVLAACALAAVLAAPGAAAVVVARHHSSDAGLPSRMPPAEVDRLSSFLSTHATGHFELASPTVVRAAPLIVHDGRPVLMLTSNAGRPLLTAGRLAGLVARRQVRYGLLGPGSCSTTLPGQRCAPVVRWALRHSQDISRSAGLPPKTLYALSASAAAARRP